MNRPIHFEKLGIIGVGLLGGAVGLAIRKNELASTVIGIGRDKTKLATAQSLGCLDEFTTDLEQGIAGCELAIIALPVKQILEIIPQIASIVDPGCIVTDVGSTKKGIVEAADARFPSDRFFVGSHPMAGSEKSGVENAPLVRFEGMTAFVTVTDQTDRDAAARVALLWKCLDMVPVMLHPVRHDFYAALMSHLPHVTACVLANVAAEAPDDINFVRQLAGRGFRDATRMASGNPALWGDICLENRENLAACIDRAIDELRKIKSALEGNDRSRLEALLENAAAFRKQLD